MKGTIDYSDLKNKPEKHELEVANYFLSLGYDVVFIRPSNIKGIHRPDIMMLGIEWEIKCPTGNTKNTIENNIKKAIQQSSNIILDLRGLRLAQDKAIAQIREQFVKRQRIRKIYVIKADGGLLKLER